MDEVDRSREEFFTSGNIKRIGEAFEKDPYSSLEVQKYRTFRLRCVNTSIRILTDAGIPEKVFIGLRLKRLDSIHRKLCRPGCNFKLNSLDDIIGVRVVCDSFNDAKNLSSRIAKLAEWHKAKDYIKDSHYLQSGYRAIHHIMKFQQTTPDNNQISVRFEVQIRSYYQHQWAIWSESKGENIKQGGRKNDPKDKETTTDLLHLSKRIALWEERNPDNSQRNNWPPYEGMHSVVVVWKYGSDIDFQSFPDGVESAVEYLNYLETRHPHTRENALLLIGISDPNRARKHLSETHPLYVLGKAYAPKYWMPSDM